MFPDGEGLQEVRPEGDVQTSGVGCVTGRIHGLVIHQDAGEAAEGSAVRRIPADRKGQVLFGALGPFAAVPFGTGIDDIFIIFVPGTGLSARRDPFSFNVRGIVPACAGAFTGRFLFVFLYGVSRCMFVVGDERSQFVRDFEGISAVARICDIFYKEVSA